MIVVSEVNGTWRKAMQVPGLAELNAGGFAEITSVSCVSAGNCGAATVPCLGRGRSDRCIAAPRHVSELRAAWAAIRPQER